MTKPVLRSVSGKDFVFAVTDGSRTPESVPTPAHTLCCMIKKYQEKLTNANIEQLDAVMRDFTTDLNGEISVISSASSYSNYASSLCMLTVNAGVATITNVGSTSAFLMRDGQLTKLTANISNKSLIGNFPSGVSVTPELSDSYEVTKNDVFLLCSDGLTNALSEDRISYILSLDLSDERLVTRLVSEALARSGSDDITAMIIRNGAPAYSSKKRKKPLITLTAGVIILAVMCAFLVSSLKSCSKKPDISHEGEVITETTPQTSEEFMTSEDGSDAETTNPEDEFILRTDR